MMKKRIGMAALLAAVACACTTANAQVVISQVYGGGGNSGAPFTNDFVELYNKGASAVDLGAGGYVIQYASATGAWSATNNQFPLVGTIQAGGYFLIQMAGGTNGIPLPTADQIVGTNMSGTAGKVALLTGGPLASSTCPPTSAGVTVVDLVGYGTTANCNESASGTSGNAPAPSNTTAIFRGVNGCTDTNNNAADFSVATPAPRNSSSPTFACPVSTPPSGVGSASPSPQCPGQPVNLFCTVTLGSNPSSPITSVVADVSNLGGVTVDLLDNGVAPDVTAGDGIYSASALIDSFVTPGNKNVNVTITDALARVGSASITVGVDNCNLRAFGSSVPDGVCNGEVALFTVAVTPGRFPDSTGIQVSADISAVGGDTAQVFYDDGTNGDVTAGDNVFSYALRVCLPTPGTARMNALVTDQQGRSLQGDQANNIGPFIQLASGACVNSSSGVVISQIYGGGGNTGGLFRNDFIELHNRTEGDIDVTGWSVQYAFNFTAPSTDQGFQAANVVALSGIIPAGGYYLIQQAQGADGSQPALPTPDAVGAVTMSSSSGRVALVRSTTAIGLNFTDPNIEDFVGYGTAAPTWEGLGTTRTLNNTTAALRDQDGCEDSNNNNLDFSLRAPSPRNSASPVVICPRVCVADVDDGTATGTPDGGVTIDDLLFYLVIFEAGDIRADVDDGSSTGARDCGVTIDDLLYYLFRFEAGC